MNFVDAVGCIGEGVKSYLALHYLGRLVCGDTGKCVRINPVCYNTRLYFRYLYF